MGQNFSSEPVTDHETEQDSNETFKVAVSSCQGWRMSQEDNHSLILDLPGEHKAAFFAVYDGHGSAKVSKHASESLWRHLTENDFYLKGQFKEALESAFLTFDREVNESYNAQLAGTTAICTLIVDNIVYCANIGDSRAVASVNCQCVPLSHDHKPENPQELKRILAAGGYVLGNRVNGNLALSRAFGDFHYKGNDQLPPEQQIVSPCPDINIIELNDDLDFLVLACDGIWDVLSSEEVVEFVISRLERNNEPAPICEQLTIRCLAPDYELVIGCDNMTVLLVCYMRGRSWDDYCTDIFNKNSKRLGESRVRPPLNNAVAETKPDGSAFGSHHLASTATAAAVAANEARNIFNNLNQSTFDDTTTTTTDPSSSTSTSWVDEQLAQQLCESTLNDNSQDSSNASTNNEDDIDVGGDNNANSSRNDDKDKEEESTKQNSQDNNKSDSSDPIVQEKQQEQVVVEVQLGSPEDGAEEEEEHTNEVDADGQTADIALSGGETDAQEQGNRASEDDAGGSGEPEEETSGNGEDASPPTESVDSNDGD